MGPVDYYSTMPLVFRHSRINLNITLKSIRTGVPLRCMDIMGSGGFLLTNFQSDLLDLFVPDEDFVFYESETDFIDKIRYYLSHEASRQQIIANWQWKNGRSPYLCASGTLDIRCFNITSLNAKHRKAVLLLSGIF